MEATELPPRLVNETFINKISSHDPVLRKQAEDGANDYTRIRVREDGFFRRVLPPIPMTSGFDRQVDTDKPVKVIDKEPNSPAAISVPFGALPMNRYIRGPRYRVMFDCIVTPRFVKDVGELLTYDMDIRQIMSDNAIKDMLAEEDGKAILTINTLLVAAGTVLPETGVAQWLVLSGGITRDTVSEAMKTLPKAANHLEVATVLINNVSIWDFVKWGRDEMGGDMSQDMLKTGFTEREFMKKRWIITIKRDLVPDNRIYLFASPKFLGKFFVMEDVTMYIDRKAYIMEMFAYERIGAAFANVAGLGIVDFAA